eukprot:SAG11_NODE_1084_length_5941_cov_5.761897_4_plen_93_part_00
MIAKAGGGAEELRTFYEVVSSGGGMADTPLFRTQASRILGGDDSFSAFLRCTAQSNPTQCMRTFGQRTFGQNRIAPHRCSVSVIALRGCMQC